MIKEYKTNAAKTGSISFKSNASTKEFHNNEEAQRFNKIMNEPIENLISNMNQLSRPVSSGIPGLSRDLTS